MALAHICRALSGCQPHPQHSTQAPPAALKGREHTWVKKEAVTLLSASSTFRRFASCLKQDNFPSLSPQLSLSPSLPSPPSLTPPPPLGALGGRSRGISVSSVRRQANLQKEFQDIEGYNRVTNHPKKQLCNFLSCSFDTFAK